MSKSKRELLAAAEQQLVKLQERIAELKIAAANEFDTSLVQAGAIVEGMFGRGEKKKLVQGKVVARKTQDKGADLIRVVVGEGFEQETLTLLINAVSRVVFDADGNPGPEPVVSAEGEDNGAADGADPLSE